jgi:hypothetical protein
MNGNKQTIRKQNKFRVILPLDVRTLIDVEIDGIDMSDYPEFCDAFVTSACFPNGKPLTESQLDKVNEDYDFVYNKTVEYVHSNPTVNEDDWRD